VVLTFSKPLPTTSLKLQNAFVFGTSDAIGDLDCYRFVIHRYIQSFERYAMAQPA
jgi:hypothetical protein